jgi:hypothetical protein
MLGPIYGDELHAKRIDSLANGAAGVLRSARLSIHAIGAAYAELAEIKPKHGIKQIDRFLSNPAFDIAEMTGPWARYVLGAREEAVVALDWTDFDDDDHMTLAAYLVTSHGRATPLTWMTVDKKSLKGKQKKYEFKLVKQLADAIPDNVRVTLLADRGFADVRFFKHIQKQGWDYVIRLRGNILVQTKDGRVMPASKRVQGAGRAGKLPGVLLTNQRVPIAAVVTKRQAGAKEPWCLATSRGDDKASDIIALYRKRFSIEETFRDQKDLRFGLGLRATHIRDPARRDRLLLLTAIAQALLTLLGAASEETGLDAYLRANTVKRRTHSLFRQGTYWYGAMPNMREDWLRPLIEAFDRIVSQHQIFTKVFAEI